MLKERGVSLTEVVVLLLLIGVAAASAIPGLINSRVAASESSAIAFTVMLNRAEESYREMYPEIGFATKLRALGPPSDENCPSPSAEHACLIDFWQSLADHKQQNGYFFSLTAEPAGQALPRTTYVIGAVPKSYNRTGARNFCSREDKVIRYRNPGHDVKADSITGSVCASFAPLQ